MTTLRDLLNEFTWFALLLPVQLALGCGALLVLARRARRARPVSRRRWARSVRGWRTLAAAAGWCAAFAVGAWLVAAAAGLPLPAPLLPRSWVTWTFLLFDTVAVCGAALALAAGRLEARGRLRRSRSQISFGGRLWFCGVMGELLAVVVAAALEGRIARQEVALMVFASGTALAVAGFAGLLAGLTGKPRPTFPLALALYVAGRLVLASGLVVFSP